MIRMIIAFLAITGTLFAVPSVQAQSARAEFSAAMLDQHPSNYFALAQSLFAQGRRDEAVRWLYIAQIRYRFHLDANPGLDADGDPALFSSLLETVGRPINEYAGGDVDGWLRAIDEALAWDAANGNGFTSKTRHAASLERTRSGLQGLRGTLERQRGDIPRLRRENGLDNR